MVRKAFVLPCCPALPLSCHVARVPRCHGMQSICHKNDQVIAIWVLIFLVEGIVLASSFGRYRNNELSGPDWLADEGAEYTFGVLIGPDISFYLHAQRVQWGSTKVIRICRTAEFLNPCELLEFFPYH